MIARVGKVVGEGNLGCAELLDRHRAESFRMTRFVVLGEREKRAVRRQDAGVTKKQLESRKAVTGLRVMRPAQAVRVELRDEQPARVYLQGMRGEGVAASGPCRSPGAWRQ